MQDLVAGHIVGVFSAGDNKATLDQNAPVVSRARSEAQKRYPGYAPLTAGLLSPVAADARLHDRKRSQLDRLYHQVITDLDALVQAVGLKAA
jgi:hypothetical protein